MNKSEKFSILVVDDERSNLDVLSHILRNDYLLYIAKNGENALRMANEHIPDLILLDIVLPDISGFEVLTELKKSENTKAITVIFITGLNSEKDEEKGLALGAVDYITKPLRHSIIKARVRTHLKIIEQMRIIEHMSLMDPLTDMPNRRNFNEQLNREWGRAIRENKPISLLMIDVDRFKVYNDTHGHPQGDSVLQTVSDILRKSLQRTTDFAARWGGEEFTVLLPGTDLSGALLIAERIRANVENAVVLRTDGIPTKVTVSIGIASENPVEKRLCASFVSAADEALYAAKAGGRNQVCCYDFYGRLND